MDSVSKHSLMAHFERKVDLSEIEKEQIADAFDEVIFPKKERLLTGGASCRYIYFVCSGCLRSFNIDGKGEEHVTQLAFEDHWISDLYSFLTQEPSVLFIETIEETILLRISKDRLDRLFVEVPVLERFFRLLFQAAYVAATQRLSRTLAEPADIRYQNLIANNPDINQRVPLIHIASFLGIKPESLSRIRKQLQR